MIGQPGLSPNGILQQLAIPDALDPSNEQTCNCTYDDLARVGSVDCLSEPGGTQGWWQTFSFDAFGNLSKTGKGGGAISFLPTYNSSTNQVSSMGSYDANGNLTNDSTNFYTWDADGNPVTIGTIGTPGIDLTFDALDRMVEQNYLPGYYQLVYAPWGAKLARMSGQTVWLGYVPLVAGDVALYGSGPSLIRYRHADWLGTTRYTDKANQALYHDGAYGPYGEPYAETGDTDRGFTGMNQDTDDHASYGLYDALYREYHPTWGRWVSPDPAGLAAVDPTNPQSWNRYAYVTNDPLALTDPLGLQNEAIKWACGGSTPAAPNPCSSLWWEADEQGCNLEGGAIDCSLAYALAGIGVAAQCPANECGAVNVGGLLVYPVAYQTGFAYLGGYMEPGYEFDTNEEALAAGALYAENQSLLNSGKEQCGMTYEVGDQFSYTTSVEGGWSNCNMGNARSEIPGNGIATGGYHSHGLEDPNYANEQFSGVIGRRLGDVGWSTYYGYPLSLATPGGRVMIYNPWSACQDFLLGSPLGTGTTVPTCP